MAVIDCYGERCAMKGSIDIDHHRKIQFISPGFGDRGTEHAATVAGHEVDRFGRCYFGSRNKIAFIFAIFVVDYDYKFPGLNIGYGGVNSIQHKVTNYESGS